MANNEVKIKLAVDGTAAVVGAVNSAGASLEALGGKAGGAQTGLDGLSGKVKDASGSMDLLGGKVKDAGAGLDGFSGKAKDAGAGALDFKNALAGLATLATAVALVKMADSVTVLNNQLKLATGSTHAAGQAYDALFDIAQRSRVSFTELGGTYASISRAGGELGISQKRLLGVTEAIGNAMTISGGSAASMNAALTQLSQGLASGTLRGDELNSVMEQAPRLAQALSEGLGVTVGELRKMGEAGEITANKVIEALEKSAPKLAAEVKDATLTMGQAFTVLQNETVRFVGDADKASGATDTLSKAMVGLSGFIATLGTTIREHETAFSILMTTLAAASVAAGLYATSAAVGVLTGSLATLATVVMAHPVLLVLGGIAAGVMALDQVAKAHAKTVRGMGEEVTSLTQRINEAEKVLAGTKGGSALTAQMQARVDAMKKARAELQAQLAVTGAGNLDTTAEDARLARHTQTMKAAEKQEKDLVEIRQKLSGVDKDYLPTLMKLNAAYEAGDMKLDEYQRMVGKLAESNYKADKSAKDGAKAADAQTSAYKDFIKSIHDKVREVENEINAGKKLSDSDKLEAEYKDALTGKLKGLSDARKTAIEASLAQLKADEQQIVTTKRMVAAYQREIETRAELDAADVASSKAREQGRLTVDAYVKSIDDANAQITLEQSLFGQSERDRNTALEQYKIELELKKQIAAIDANGGFDQAQREEETARARAAADTAKAGAAAKAHLSAMTGVLNSIDATAHDVFVNIFDGGSSAFKKLGQTLKASVLDLLYQMTVKKWIFQIGASVTGGGLSGAANAATGGGGGLIGNIGTASSLYSTLSTGYAGAVGSGVSSLFGTTAGNAAISTALTGSASSAAAAAQAAAIAGGAAETAAAAAAGLGSSLGALAAAAPYIAAFVGVAYLASKYVSPGTSHMGGGSQYSAAGGLQTTGKVVPESVSEGHWAPNGDGDPIWVADRRVIGAYLETNTSPGFATGMGTLGYSQSSVDMTTGIAQGIVGLLDATAETFGKAAGYMAATTFADDTSKDGAWGSLLISNMEGVLLNWADTQTGKWAPKEFSDGATGATEYQAAIAADVRGVLDKIGLPEWATSMLAAIGDTPDLASLGAAVAQINLVKGALDTMGDKLTGFAAMSDSAVSALIAASGGFDKLAASASTYYDNFYSDGEKTAFAMGEIGKQLAAVGQTVPDTREAFRAQVEYLQSIADTEPAAAPALAAMLGLSGAFAAVVPATEAASAAVAAAAADTDALKDALDALRSPIRSVEDVANSIFKLEGEGKNLQVELLRAYGDSTSVMQANKLQRDIETAGMTAQEVVLYDLNATRREEIDAIAAAKQATADGIASWENYFSLFATAPEKQARAESNVSAVLGSDVDTLAEYRQLVQSLTEQFGIGSAEVKRVTDVASDFAIAFPEVATALAEVTDAAADTAQAVGFDAAGLAAMITRAAFESADVGGAAAGFAAALSDSVRNAMISSVVGDIANSIYTSIITPIIAGAAVSEATTEAVIANATAQIAALSELFASDTFAGLLESITSAVAPTLAPIAELSVAADSAAGSVQGLTNVMEGINNAIDVSRLTHWQNLITPDALSGAKSTVANSDDPSLTVAETLTANILARVRDLSGAYRGIEVELMAVHLFLGRVSEDAQSLQNTLMNAGDTAIGQGLQLTPLIDFFSDLNVTATAIADAINEFPGASLTYEGDWSEGMITIDGMDAATLATIGDAAGTVGATLTQAFADSIAEAITTALPDVSTDILATVGGVGQGDTQSLVNAFTILSGALVDGSLTAEQYATAIELVNDSYLNGSTDNSAIAAERAGLQEQLDLLTGVTTARELERNALDETNRALYDQVQAAQAAKTAAEALAAAEKTADDAKYAKAKAVAAERAGLQEQLDLLTGVTTARELERAALDETNQALYDQVEAAKLVKAEADRFTASMESLAATLANTDISMLDAQAGYAAASGDAAGSDALSAEADAARRALAIEGMTAEEVALYDLNAARQAEIAALQDSTSTIIAEAERIKSSLASLSGTGDSLEIELQRALGNVDLADAMQAAIDTAGMTDAELALYSYNQAIQDQIDAANAATDAAEALAQAQQQIADERTGLQDQLDSLTMTSVELLAKQRDALDESNRALFDQVQAAQAAQAEADRLSASLENLGGAGDSLEIELQRALGNVDLADAMQTALDTAGMGEAELALYSYNQALRDQITAAQAAQAETDRITASIQSLSDALAGSDIDLLDAQAAYAAASGDAGTLGADAEAARRVLAIAGMTAEEVALYDLNAARQTEIAATQAATQALITEADRLSASLESLTGTGDSLEIELQRALGNVDLADAMQAALDTAGMTDAELALYAYNQSLRDQIDAANAAEGSIASLTQAETERLGLERQLLQVQGDTAALRALDLAALDPSNRALQEHIWALEDEKTAADEAAAASKAIADERLGLEQQLMQAMGDTAGLRALELAALDPSNRAIQEHIWALEDLQSATEATTSAWESLTDSLMKEVDRIRGVMAESSTDSMAALQARFTIATAQARAGDQEAAGNLAGYSSALLSAAADDAGSRMELIRLQAQIAESLTTTAGVMGQGNTTQQGASVTAFVPPVPPQTPPPANEKLEALVVQLTAEIVTLKNQMSSIQQNTRRTADAVNGAGEAPMVVEVDA